MNLLSILLLLNALPDGLEEKMMSAVELYKEGNFTRSIHLFEQIDRHKEAPFYCSAKYNLARAYHKNKQVEQARAKYEDYISTCRESDEDQNAAKRHFKELIKSDFGSLKLSCVDQGLKVKIDKQAPEDCPITRAHILAGAHQLQITSDERLLEARAVKITANQEARVPIPAFPRLVVQGAGSGEVLVDGIPISTFKEGALITAGPRSIVIRRAACLDEARDLKFHPGQQQTITLDQCRHAAVTRGAGPWIMAGTGAALVLAGFVFYSQNHAAMELDDRDKIELYYDLTWVSYGLGGGLLLGGLTWGLWPMSAPDDVVSYGLTWSAAW